MKGLIGFCFGLLTFAYTALAVVLCYAGFRIQIWLGIVEIIFFALIYVAIVISIKKKFAYYKTLQEQNSKQSNNEQANEQKAD